ncbi:hypothetical protein [Microbacterium candidum]|uniref:DUF1801 domain-containing protein n=1 Tax=Microbacterium candidum TaxID=3041922 RepID=A0ABT7MTY3_9MICO|nr:hypothetical protein [Microbacterium sp. ASV49]MDL9977893.1 hypothetical protein [Microbacterium sp. ASV49]
MSATLSDIEREAVKNRAKELRAQEKAGKDRAAGLAAVEEAIAKLEGLDQELAAGVHRIVTEVAPHLVPKTYYGFAAYANAEGKVVCFFKPSSKFKVRYATFEFEAPAALDDGDMWPVSFAILALTPATEKRIAELVKRAAA